MLENRGAAYSEAFHIWVASFSTGNDKLRTEAVHKQPKPFFTDFMSGRAVSSGYHDVPKGGAN